MDHLFRDYILQPLLEFLPGQSLYQTHLIQSEHIDDKGLNKFSRSMVILHDVLVHRR